MSSDAWMMDAVLHARLERLLGPRGTTVSDWLGQLIATNAHASWSRDLHASTMGEDASRNFQAVDEPCGLRMPFRVTLEDCTRIVHVRAMPLGQGMTYMNYGPLDDDEEDADRLWNRPVLACATLALPDTACAALTGRRVCNVAWTGNEVLDGMTIDWAAVEERRVLSRMLSLGPYGSRTDAGGRPLVLRLVPAEPQRMAVVPSPA